MAVTLIRKMSEVPPGFTSDEVKSNFASLEEATAQAVADVESGAETTPVRIMSENGDVLLDQSGIEAAVADAAEDAE
jgi:hypothetical protein